MGGIAESVANGSESVTKKLALSSSATANSIKVCLCVYSASQLSDGCWPYFTRKVMCIVPPPTASKSFTARVNAVPPLKTTMQLVVFCQLCSTDPSSSPFLCMKCFLLILQKFLFVISHSFFFQERQSAAAAFVASTGDVSDAFGAGATRASDLADAASSSLKVHIVQYRIVSCIRPSYTVKKKCLSLVLLYFRCMAMLDWDTCVCCHRPDVAMAV